MNGIDGKPVPLARFKGQVLLVVNVASKCGNTPQYAGLEALYRKNKAKGFAVLGFPANDFNRQEPGTNAEIYQFCTETYKVTFPMFAKIVVKGEGIAPLYQWLLDNDGVETDIDWNFAKFLIGRDGKVMARFPAKTQPDAPEVLERINQALAKK
ncbi:MAG: glutathione peroxidase [Fimbriimonadaceae bacterium]|nr:glutathione peroxidase [Fimbriimonadaceae bacterium]